MPVAQSVVGYLADSVVNDLKQGKGLGNQSIELPLQPGQSASRVRVQAKDIDEVRIGPSGKGHTSVQFILKPEASYELVSAAPSEENTLAAIHDPSFVYGISPLRFVIYAFPVYKNESGTFKLM